ncbi:hypothetical protein K470DRAFT_175009 [Piedraia hortae CBS 480.64]|uniref:Uncharacterized protein n=1 Tax=Piedraia hortae CBS 480.64 TaxID=1314780 RepID=A0A6A7C5N7_9PEZI|nr:hypothetical protein K470DRAFT_175009 [Piedraia hortae CBS 480.64]
MNYRWISSQKDNHSPDDQHLNRRRYLKEAPSGAIILFHICKHGLNLLRNQTLFNVLFVVFLIIMEDLAIHIFNFGDCYWLFPSSGPC